jgi:hypothetical protein
MAKLFSLAWRYLLVAALVLNPVVGAAASIAPPTGKAPPCHDMAMHHDAAAPADDSTPDPGHGCGCGNTACQFACCAAIAFAVPALRLAPLAHSQAPAAPDPGEAAPPPRSRMIRPPIA